MLEVDSVSSSSLIPSIWDSMLSWLTPAVLFLLLNLTIATIALTSSLSKPTSPDTKSPPSVLQRLRSLHLSPFKPPHNTTDHVTHVEQQQQHHHHQQQPRSLDDVFSQIEVRQVSRTTSDSASLPEKKLPKRMRKSASMKSAFGHFGQDDVAAAVEARRPATVKEGNNRADADVDDDEVDAKADDFINRFKNQLKLQRMDSIVRYKEMIGRGGAN